MLREIVFLSELSLSFISGVTAASETRCGASGVITHIERALEWPRSALVAASLPRRIQWKLGIRFKQHWRDLVLKVVGQKHKAIHVF